MFLYKADQIPRMFLLLGFTSSVYVVPRTPAKVFLRSSFSDIYVQVVSSTHSNLQLLYLLLFFVVLNDVTTLNDP